MLPNVAMQVFQRPAHFAVAKVDQRTALFALMSSTRRIVRRHSGCSNALPSMKIFNSLSNSVESVSPSQKAAAVYACGPTVYAPAHLGHARTYVWLDILRRCMEHYHLQFNLPPPLFVLNITDVDDKILNAASESESPLELARRFEKEFWMDMDALNCLRPHVVTRVTEHVESTIIPYIQRLEDNGVTYQLEQDPQTAGVYFSVQAFERITGHEYGKMAPTSAAETIHRTDSNEPTVPGKRDPRDFVLWKRRKEGEDMFWESQWGAGRPGWHIECSAMIEAVQEQFKETHKFTMHAGGVDLKFPHHTNEIAQAEAFHFRATSTVSKEPWIPHWLHTGHLHIDGMKMSKSLKNFITIKDMLSPEKNEFDEISTVLAAPADDFRLWCLGLSGPYRSSATYSKERMDESRRIRQKIVRFLVSGHEWLYQRKHSTSNSKVWRKDDVELLTKLNAAAVNGRRALLADLDGKTFLNEALFIAQEGLSFIQNEHFGDAPIEPVKASLKLLRHMLRLVGFSDSTSRAGLDIGQTTQDRSIDRALIDEVVRFRSTVRHAAIAELKENKSSNVATIMEQCDALRDAVLPQLGVELTDATVNGGSNDGWRYCAPKTASPLKQKGTSALEKKQPETDLLSVDPVDMFSVGIYEGMFKEYNEAGIPVLNADGTPVSKRQTKKLVKKQAKLIQHQSQAS